KAMVDTGHAADAQKVILGELEKKFGGSAAAAGGTFAGQMNVAKENLRNLAGDLVGSLVPAIEVFSSVLGAVTGLMQENERITRIAVIAVAALAPGISALKAAMIVGPAATEAMTAAQWLFNIALDANPIGVVIVGLAALGAAFIVAWKKSETFRDIVTGTWDAVKDGVTTFVDFFKVTLPDAFQSVKNWVSDHWPEIATLLSGPFAPVVGLATGAFGITDALKKALHAVAVVGGDIETAAAAVSNAVKRGIESVVWGFVDLLQTRVITPKVNLVETVLAKAK